MDQFKYRKIKLNNEITNEEYMIGDVWQKPWPKWVNNYKQETIQLVGAGYKLYIFLATRVLKTRFWAPKSSL